MAWTDAARLASAQARAARAKTGLSAKERRGIHKLAAKRGELHPMPRTLRKALGVKGTKAVSQRPKSVTIKKNLYAKMPKQYVQVSAGPNPRAKAGYRTQNQIKTVRKGGIAHRKYTKRK